MSNLVDPSEIESIVGAQRDQYLHIGRADSVDQIFYILHSQECVNREVDLRKCLYSQALDRGINPSDWEDYEDQPTFLSLNNNHLVPAGFWSWDSSR